MIAGEWSDFVIYIYAGLSCLSWISYQGDTFADFANKCGGYDSTLFIRKLMVHIKYNMHGFEVQLGAAEVQVYFEKGNFWLAASGRVLVLLQQHLLLPPFLCNEGVLCYCWCYPFFASCPGYLPCCNGWVGLGLGRFRDVLERTKTKMSTLLDAIL